MSLGAALAISIVACESPTAPGVIGEYALVAINGRSLPSGESSALEYNSWFITLNPGGEITGDLTYTLRVPNTPVEVHRLSTNGTWARQGRNTIAIYFSNLTRDHDGFATVREDGGLELIGDLGDRFTFRRP